MHVLTLHFKVPEEISQGLASGKYSRFGSVVKDLTNHGKFCYHIKEVDLIEQVLNEVTNPAPGTGKSINLTDKIFQVNKNSGKLADIKTLQMLNDAGLAGVDVICIAGFVYMGYRLDKIENCLQELEKNLKEVQRGIEYIKNQNTVALSEDYYAAVAAFREGDFITGDAKARDCSAKILNYILNMPADDVVGDERVMQFLMTSLISAMQCQLHCAYQSQTDKIHLVLHRYEDLFADIVHKINAYRAKLSTALPTANDLRAIQAFKNPESFLSKLTTALPKVVPLAQSERRFIELCPPMEPAMLEDMRQQGYKYIIVAEPDAPALEMANPYMAPANAIPV